MKGQRGAFPGTFRHSKNRWGMKVYIDGELHYLGCMSDRAEASSYVKLVESRYPKRLRRPRGTVRRYKNRWLLLGPRPERKRLGWFDTQWEAELKRRELQ